MTVMTEARKDRSVKTQDRRGDGPFHFYFFLNFAEKLFL